MDSQPDISIVFPAYNEAANIEASILDAIQVLNSLGLNGEIVVVNDGSHDQTANVVRDVATRHQPK
jgi:dolichyl-phosphate beta-glucosyltransferase